jgi:hypothetical protein
MIMRTIIYTIAIFFTSLIIYSQDFEYLKKSDTIYIEFKGKKNEKKYSIQTRIQPTNFDERAYDFVVQDKWGLYFQHSKYENWEKKEANIVSDVKKINKSFLKKHKKDIIGIDFFKKYKSVDIVCKIFTQSKVIYIIDFTEKKKNEFKMYEVSSMNVCPVSE